MKDKRDYTFQEKTLKFIAKLLRLEVMVWSLDDHFKATMRGTRGELKVISTKDHGYHDYINIYKNNNYETSLKI